MDSNKTDRKRIALIGYKFCYGGLEKAMSNISFLLESSDIDVFTIVLDDEVCYPYGWTLINLGKNKKISKYLQLKRILRKNQVDYVIDFRYRLNPLMELLFLLFIYRKFKLIYTVHSSNLEAYFTKSMTIANFIISQVYKVIAVSEGISDLIKKNYKITNLSTIYNFVDIEDTKEEFINTLPYQYIIGVGRLEKMKQFDKLIEAYSKTNLNENNIHLVILGDGEEKEALNKLISHLKIEKYVHLLGFVSQPYFYIEKALYLVLSSKYEGFGMVLLESLLVRTPVVSFDCKVGPNEIVIDKKNGILVPDQDFNMLILSMNKMYEDAEFYEYCKKNARKSVLKFSKLEVVKQWLQLLKI